MTILALRSYILTGVLFESTVLIFLSDSGLALCWFSKRKGRKLNGRAPNTNSFKSGLKLWIYTAVLDIGHAIYLELRVNFMKSWEDTQHSNGLIYPSRIHNHCSVWIKTSILDSILVWDRTLALKLGQTTLGPLLAMNLRHLGLVRLCASLTLYVLSGIEQNGWLVSSAWIAV